MENLIINVISFVLTILFFVYMFIWIRKFFRFLKKNKEERIKRKEDQAVLQEKLKADDIAKKKEAARKRQEAKDKIWAEMRASKKRHEDNVIESIKNFKANNPDVNFDDKFKNNIEQMTVTLHGHDIIEGSTNYICKNRDNQVFFPDADNPCNLFYLIGVSFNPKYNSINHIVKGQKAIPGKPGKRGHYVRNTIMFGLIGTMATHDKVGTPGTAGTPDQIYTTQQEVPTTGYLKLISTDFKHEYSLEFEGDSDTANELIGKYAASQSFINNLEHNKQTNS